MVSEGFMTHSGVDFMPHGMCYLWRPDILALHVVSDLLIAMAYASIPFTLLHFVRKRWDLQFNWIFVCFAVFIVACGLTHVMEIWTIWHPDYWLSGALKAVTAVASGITAVLLVRLVPTALSIPSPSALRSTHAELEREIAERRRTEEELRVANRHLIEEAARGRLAAIVESSNDAIIGESRQGTITSWNHSAERLFGYLPSEVIGRSSALLRPPNQRDEAWDAMARLERGECTVNVEVVKMRKDGKLIDVSATYSPIRDTNGTILGASKILRDITERKRAEEARLEQNNILDLAQVIVRDPQGRITRWSRGAEKLYGYTDEEALGNISYELLQTRFPEPLEQIEAQLVSSGVWEGEVSNCTRGGTRLDIASVWVLHRDAQGKARRILESNTDVTARKRAEYSLAAQLGRLSLLNVITRAISERQDLPSIFQIVIDTLEAELPIDFGCVCLHEPPDTLVIAGTGGNTGGPVANAELSVSAKVPIEPNGLARCLGGALLYDADLRVVESPFSRTLRSQGLHAMVAAPLLVGNNAFGILIAARRAPHSFSADECDFLRQLSEHVALAAYHAQLYGALEIAYEDLRQTQNAVMRHEKLRVLGQMASGIAHDINNALSPATLYVESLLTRESQNARTTGDLLIIQGAIDGVAQTVARIKEFYSERDPNSPHAPVDLNRAVEDVIALTQARWKTLREESGIIIHVAVDLAANLPHILGNESEIRDALTNLLLNAVDAMPEGGRCTVRTAPVGLDRVSIDVIDTGIGMDEATRGRCLEPFYTTKGVRGTGLGLAMVYGTVERHGAELQIDSVVGVGTTVRVIFEGVAEDGRHAQRPRETIHPPQSIRILVIDDDAILLRSLLDTLTREGHVVETADGGSRGIEAFRRAYERDEPFSIVITDLGMPNIDGRKVAAAVKSIRPETRVILLTGWGHRLLAEDETPHNIDRVIAKPPKLAGLRAVFAELGAEARV